MSDIFKKAEYWTVGANEDLEVGESLVRDGSVRHGLFFMHLALEKLLKAHYCNNKKDQPPKIHNLLQIAELAGIDLDVNQKDMLSIMNRFCTECRYPTEFAIVPNDEDTKRYLENAGEIFQWLMQQLKI
jgi:HEPN domain-containing protein